MSLQFQTLIMVSQLKGFEYNFQGARPQMLLNGTNSDELGGSPAQTPNCSPFVSPSQGLKLKSEVCLSKLSTSVTQLAQLS